MKIVVTADSTCDIPKSLIEKYKIIIFPLTVIMGEQEYRDGVNIDSNTIYQFVDKYKILPKTSATTTYEYKEVFQKLKEEYDAIIHFSLSFEISSTGNNALLASQEFENVYVIDTKSLSSGSGLLVLSCAEKVQKGLPLEQILEECRKEVDKVQCSFLINKLDYLKKGGRCSAIAFIGAKLLGLKVLIQLFDGKMDKGGIYKGKYSVCLSKYLKDMIEKYPPNLNRVFVTSSSPMPGIRDAFVEEVRALGFKDVIVQDAGATICSHCGPETIGVLYLKQ